MNDKKLKRMYHFKGRVVCHDEYCISRDVSHSTLDIIIQDTYHTPRQNLLSRDVSHAIMNTLTDLSLMGLGWDRTGAYHLIMHSSPNLVLHFIVLELWYTCKCFFLDFWLTLSCVLLIWNHWSVVIAICAIEIMDY